MYHRRGLFMRGPRWAPQVGAWAVGCMEAESQPSKLFLPRTIARRRAHFIGVYCVEQSMAKKRENKRYQTHMMRGAGSVKELDEKEEKMY